MEILNKLESTIHGWVKSVPHLPVAGQKWLGQNVWWIVLIGTILSAIAGLVAIGGIFTLLALMSAYAIYAPTATVGSLIGAIVSVVFLVLQVLLMAMAIKPLKAGQKKGWVILFASWLLNIVSVVLGAVLSFSIFGFITGILFGAIGVAISGYFLFEIHGQFAHTVKHTAKKA